MAQCGLGSNKFVPQVQASLNGVQVKALIDTGATFSCAAAKFVRDVMGEGWLQDNMVCPSDAPFFLLGDGSKISAVGLVTLPVVIGGTTFEAKVFLFTAPPYQLLLGAQFLFQHNIDTRVRAGELVSTSRPAWRVALCSSGKAMDASGTRVHKILAADDCWLKPGEERLEWGFVPPSAELSKGASVFLSMNMEALSCDALMLPGLSLLQEGLRSRIVLGNYSDQPSFVKRGTQVGWCEEMDANSFHKVALNKDDPAFRPSLQEAVDEVRAQRQRAEKMLTPMYFDQLGGQQQGPTLSEEGLPADLDLKGTACNAEELRELKELLKEFAPYFTDKDAKPNVVRNFEFKMELNEGAVPARQKERRLPQGPMLQDAIRQLDAMERNGIIEPCEDGEWASNIVLVPKAGAKPGDTASCRITIDYRRLNACLKPGLQWNIPTVQDVFDQVGKAPWFSCIDLAAGYHQIRVRPGDKHLTAFNSPAGTKQFTVASFGIKTLPAFFSQMMDKVYGPQARCVRRNANLP